MARPQRTLGALAAGALGAAAVARWARRTAPPVAGEPPAPPVPPPPAPRVVPPPPVPQRRPARIWVMYVVGWPSALSMFLVVAVSLTLSGVWGSDAVRHVDWFFWGSLGVMPVGAVLLWFAARDDEERTTRNAWAYSLWQASHRRGPGGHHGTTGSGYSSSSYVGDPTYGAAWSGGYDGGSSYDGGGYSSGPDGGGGGGFSSSY